MPKLPVTAIGLCDGDHVVRDRTSDQQHDAEGDEHQRPVNGDQRESEPSEAAAVHYRGGGRIARKNPNVVKKRSV